MTELERQADYIKDIIRTADVLTTLAATFNPRISEVKKIIKECENQVYDLLHLCEDFEDRDPSPGEYEYIGRKLSELRTRRRDAKKALYVLESNQRVLTGLYPALKTADGTFKEPSPLGNPTYKSLRLRSAESLDVMADLECFDPEAPIKVLPPHGYEPPKEEVPGLLGDSTTHIEIDEPEKGVMTVFGLPPQIGKVEALTIPETWFEKDPVAADDKFDALAKIVNAAPAINQVKITDANAFDPIPEVSKKAGSFVVYSKVDKKVIKKSANFVVVLNYLIHEHGCQPVRFDHKTYQILKVFAANYRRGKTKGADSIMPDDFERLYSNCYF